MNLNEVKQAPYNPRKFSKKSLEGLKESMEEFNDISGIVFNKRTKNLVSGNHRFKLLKQIFGKLKPQKVDGTDIVLLCDSDGNPTGYTMKIVDWDIEKEKLANITANAKTIQGEFTDKVSELLNEIAEETNKKLAERLNLPEIKFAFKDTKIEFPKKEEIEQVSDEEIRKALEDDIEFEISGDHELIQGEDISNFKEPELPPYTNIRIKIPTDRKSQVISAFSNCLEELGINDFSIG